LRKLLLDRNINANEVVYLGNDVNDLPCFPLVGWAVAVADAMPEVIRQADSVLTRSGGHAAVRELCDWIVEQLSNNPHSQ
jgi:N-acylneuraminate cytidylyltransferase